MNLIFFQNNLKTVSDIKKMYIIKIEGLIIVNLLARHILISVTVFEKQGFKKSQKHPPPLILGKYYTAWPSRGDSRFPINFATPSPWQIFFKTSFFKISQKPLGISKKIIHQTFSHTQTDRHTHVKLKTTLLEKSIGIFTFWMRSQSSHSEYEILYNFVR